MKLGSYLLLSLSLITCSLQAALPNSSWLQKIQTDDELQLVLTPEEDYSRIYKSFEGAKKSIQIGIFGIANKTFADKLIEQKKRNIQIQVLCDKYCRNNPKRLEIVNYLETNGIKVTETSKAFSITHWKMFIVDEKLAFVSTMNIVNRFYQMRDFGVFVTDPQIVKEIVSVFKQDLINAEQNTSVTPLLTSPNLVWSPVNAESKLTDLIQSAETSIDIWIENLGHSKIHAALINAKQRGVEIRILSSICGMGASHDFAYKNYEELKQNGIIVQGMAYPADRDLPYIHAKSIHIDQKYFFMGSQNFSANSINKARELGIVFKNKNIQNKLHQLFEEDWRLSTPMPLTPPKGCSALPPPQPSLIDIF